MIVTVIGRGHSGTRAIAETLIKSGVYMGRVNRSADMVPPGAMYAAARMCGSRSWWQGGDKWTFQELVGMEEPPKRFRRLLLTYLGPLYQHDSDGDVGWKLPETLLTLPWLVKVMPDVHYIYWVRHPWDVILRQHVMDDLARWNVQSWPVADIITNRALSWKYQYDLVKATPKPKRWLQVRLEDYVLEQEKTLERLEGFLGIPLARLPVKYDAVGRWKRSGIVDWPPFLEEPMRELGYIK